MDRVRRHLGTLVPLLLFVATVALWVTSYFHGWEIKTKGPTGPNGGIVNAIELGLDAISTDGVLCIKYNICVWTIPYWQLATVLLYFGIRTWVPWPVITIRRPPNEIECRTCGYDLTGNTSGTCPECGSLVPTTAQTPDLRT